MKRSMLIMWLCAILLTFMTGCSDNESNTQSADIVEAVNESKDTAVVSEEKENEGTDAVSEEKVIFTDLNTEEVPQAENIDESKFNDELSGDVKEINSTEKFIVISRIYVTTADDGTQTAVAPAEGSSEEELIKVYFTDKSKYLLKAGKADGSNHMEAESSFSEIIVGDSLDLRGMMDTTGTEFLACEVDIIRVID